MRCFTCSNNRLPKAPAGWDSAKSSAVKPRASSNATASASPKAKVAVVLEVGARPSGQASWIFPKVKATSAFCGIGPLLSPLMVIKGISRRLIKGMSIMISSLLPELEIAISTSPGTSMPKSPCPASPGCIKNDGVPVEAKVAAILRPICPDFPIPVMTKRPRHCKIISQARLKRSSICAANISSACSSIRKVSNATFWKSIWFGIFGGFKIGLPLLYIELFQSSKK